MKSNIRPHLLAAEDKRLPSTVIVATLCVVSISIILNVFTVEDTWVHGFFFKRGVVQWILLMAFVIGLVHLFRHIPTYWREKRALDVPQDKHISSDPETLVARRWQQIQAAFRDERRRRDIGHYAKSLAEHDEAEVDAAYRVSGDVVQILPLIGFFGTVYGLSHGLYQSFLATGGTTTKGFAKAIAIAFDNTLLGLALTIVLFVVQSILRKHEEAMLLQLNLLVSDAVATNVQEPVIDPLQVAIVNLGVVIKDQKKTLEDLVEQLVKSRKALESPAEEIKELVHIHLTEAAEAVIAGIAEMQKVQNDKVASAILVRLEEQANRLLAIVSDRAMALAKVADPLQTDLAHIKATLTDLSGSAQSVTDQVTAIAKDTPRPQLEELSAAVNALVTAIAQHHSLMLDRLQAIEDAKARLTDLSGTAQSIAEQVTALANGTHSPQLEDISAAVKSLVSAMSQRDTMMLERLQAIEETKKKLDAVAAETHITAQTVLDFGSRLDAVPEERRTVVEVAVSIKELAKALAQRDSTMLTSLQGSLEVHSRDIKNEIRLPRTIKFVEASDLPGRDGELQSQ